MRPAQSLFTRFLRFFFYLIYQPLAWSYDLVAWVVSLGQWKSWIFSSLPLLPGPRVLELGHGPGHLQLALHQMGTHTFGLDQSRQMSLLAHRRLQRSGYQSNLSRGLAQNLPFPANSFDQVVSTFPPEYIVQQELLAAIKRVLRPSGSFIVLPVAWIRSPRLLGRLAAWLFRATGQAASWDMLFSDKFRIAGFVVEERRVTLPESEVVLLIAKRD
jgi:ubiquinone/menaquinone biosynthesis C-methylase UbiE